MGNAVFFRSACASAIAAVLVVSDACGNSANASSPSNSDDASDASTHAIDAEPFTATTTSASAMLQNPPRAPAVARPGVPTLTYAHVYTQASFTTLYAISDVHGHVAQFETLLVAAGLVSSTSAFPNSVTWTGGDATLVIDGDMIDKGPASLEVIELAMALVAAVNAQKIGTVVVLLGNHEAEFLATPNGRKFSGADRIDTELASQNPPISPVDFAAGTDPRGAFLRTLPFAAKIGGYFLSHAGNSNGFTLGTLDRELDLALASTTSWSSDFIIGANSLLEADDWYTSQAVVNADLAALGVSHILFGHDPGAFSSKGVILQPASFHGALVKLDSGLGAGYSNGAMYRVRHVGANEVAEVLLPDGSITTP